MVGRLQGVTGAAGAIVSMRGMERAAPHVEPVRPVTAARIVAGGIDRRAEFLAQLIAAREGLPQARERRRADPADAVAAYGRSARLDVIEVPPGFDRNA